MSDFFSKLIMRLLFAVFLEIDSVRSILRIHTAIVCTLWHVPNVLDYTSYFQGLPEVYGKQSNIDKLNGTRWKPDDTHESRRKMMLHFLELGIGSKLQ